jgi:hypothetical protein
LSDFPELLEGLIVGVSRLALFSVEEFRGSVKFTCCGGMFEETRRRILAVITGQTCLNEQQEP